MKVGSKIFGAFWGGLLVFGMAGDTTAAKARASRCNAEL